MDVEGGGNNVQCIEDMGAARSPGKISVWLIKVLVIY